MARARRLAARLRREGRWLINLLLPACCPLCRRPLPEPLRDFCPDCQQQLLLQPRSACVCCAEPLASASQTPHRCSHCLIDPPDFLWLRSAGLYREQLRQAVIAFKFHHQIGLARPLARLLLHTTASDIAAFAPTAVIAVPLHPQRLRQRGFNPALLLAVELAKILRLPLERQALQRNRATAPQSGLDRRQRLGNLRNAFQLTSTLPPQHILLVDDVATTTATVRHCSACLAAAGHRVAVVTLARASLADEQPISY
ncbi:ComF family protein [Desulfuromonas thiophila]|uniref:ComF family protein n=1 Tax=Desulfuromonas thiophila TaxID=57664 RepID=A0A1G6XQC8_9BACT|nr:ComF family protein [Desulfuromonas thiophila]SDD80222.1 comF family protein [Desulfuromonas thiophila]